MSTPPAAKRRRVDSLGIHKPFVSPLKRNKPIASSDDPTHNATTTPKPTTRLAQAPATPYTPLRSSNLKTFSTPLPSQQQPQDAEVTQAQHQIRNLESRIRHLRDQNATLQQGLQITSVPPSSTSFTSGSSYSQQQTPRLARLQEKWKTASQAAAEEVFDDFSTRIKESGGYSAFLRQQSQNKQNSLFDDDEDEKEQNNEDNWRDEDGDCLTERGKAQRRCEIEDAAREKGGEGEDQEEEEEEELTLGAMLQILNIPFDVIGWDTKTQAWE